MSDLFPLIGDASASPLRPKKNTTGDLQSIKGRIGRVARKAPEVMVKITGSTSGAQHIKSHIDYIDRNGKIELENERGAVLQTKEEIRDEFRDWMRELGKPRKNSRDTINIILSMPASKASTAQVQDAAREFARERFGENHRYLMAVHSPENGEGNHPHVHLTVKARGFDGRKLDPKKADLEVWRETFAEKLRQQGCEAEATPRRTRGVVEKGRASALYALEVRKRDPLDAAEKPRGSRVYVARVMDAREALAGRPASTNPYTSQIQASRQRVLSSWEATAKTLEASDSQDDKTLAAQIRTFIAERFAGERQAKALAEKTGRPLEPAAIVDARARLREELRLRALQHTAGAKKEAGREGPPNLPSRSEPEPGRER